MEAESAAEYNTQLQDLARELLSAAPAACSVLTSCVRPGTVSVMASATSTAATLFAAGALPAASTETPASCAARPDWLLAHTVSSAGPGAASGAMSTLLEAIGLLDSAAAGCSNSDSAARAARDSSRLGAWMPAEKQGLLDLVAEMEPCGAADWEAVAERLGRWSPGGASAERMYRTLTDPGYQKTTNKHGRRLNARCGTPMHIMAAFALQRLPDNEGNLTQIAQQISEEPRFAAALAGAAAAPRPGTKTYARWKDALVGCFKAGRYAHFSKSDIKTGGLKVYRLEPVRMPPKVTAALAALGAGGCGGPASSSAAESGFSGSGLSEQ
ncbi:hypothetical protein WJX81_008615 [Elliptochloris bilobata]|uniref:Myb-like domain-containing protein n=1 Tax=Elliptochloris bilobata TaxID=381761 RepID=A0AAW1RD25_9CHLO